MDKQNSASKNEAVPGKDASKDAVWRYETPQQDAGAGAAESTSAHYTGAGGGVAGGDERRDGGFVHSDPENNVVAPGAPQSGRGSAQGSEHGMGGIGAGPSSGGGGGNPGGDTDAPSAGAGAGAAPGTPKGNGSKDEPIWGS